MTAIVAVPPVPSVAVRRARAVAATARATTPPGPEPSVRAAGIDAVRFLASTSVVWVHGVSSELFESSRAIGRIAVPFFCLVAGWVLVAGLRRRTADQWGVFLGGRLKRLYVPFLAWTVVYSVAYAGASLVVSPQPWKIISLSDLWSGTIGPLWFLPFLLASSIVLFPVIVLTLGSRTRERIACAVLAVAGLILAFQPPLADLGKVLGTELVVALAWHRFPCFLWGVALGLLIRTPLGSIRPTTRFLVPAVLAVAGSIAYVWVAGRHSAVEGLGGIGLLVLALVAIPMTSGALSVAQSLGALSFGIYLSHGIFIMLGRKFASNAGVLGTWQADIGVFLFALLGAVILTRSIHRWSWTRLFLP